jgi:hypothetical protein
MKMIKYVILIAAVFSIAGMAFLQLLVLLLSALFAQQVYTRHQTRQGGLKLMD